MSIMQTMLERDGGSFGWPGLFCRRANTACALPALKSWLSLIGNQVILWLAITCAGMQPISCRPQRAALSGMATIIR
jgi:hypothetical protein